VDESSKFTTQQLNGIILNEKMFSNFQLKNQILNWKLIRNEPLNFGSLDETNPWVFNQYLLMDVIGDLIRINASTSETIHGKNTFICIAMRTDMAFINQDHCSKPRWTFCTIKFRNMGVDFPNI
tara:strand:- start:3813 stop:4184 length:372 start_codon:yes stop_codon:yes gene_type:complete